MPNWSHKILSSTKLGPFEDGAELGKIRIRPDEVAWALGVEASVKAKFAFDIAFGAGPPAYGQQAADLLGRISDRVAAILTQFQTRCG